MDSWTRFLNKLRELTSGKLTDEERVHFNKLAAGHAGGSATAEKRRAQPVTCPYDRLEAIPGQVRQALPEKGAKVWMAAFNSAWKAHPGDDATCAKLAWAAVKQAGYARSEQGWQKAGEQEVDVGAIAEAVAKSQLSPWPLLDIIALAEGARSGSVQIFPPVGVYSHPRWGKLAITPEFLAEVKRNFDEKVYQQDLPITIDLEHESKLSGAAGWIASVEIRGDRGMWATLNFNDRGYKLVTEDAYRYYSPEYYDSWTDPATNQQYHNVVIGGALTNRPFFKGMHPVMLLSTDGLLPCVFAEEPDSTETGEGDATPSQEESEGGDHSATAAESSPGADSAGGTPVGMTAEELKRLTDAEANNRALNERLEAEATARQAAEAQAKQALDEIATWRKQDRRRALTEFVGKHRLAFEGEVPQIVDRLELMEEKLGPELFAEYQAGQVALAVKLAESALLKPTSGVGGEAPSGAWAELQAEARQLVEAKAAPTLQAAEIQVAQTNPALYKRYLDEQKRRQRRGEED